MDNGHQEGLCERFEIRLAPSTMSSVWNFWNREANIVSGTGPGRGWATMIARAAINLRSDHPWPVTAALLA